MKIGIDIGHNCPPSDTGAVGFKKEDDLAKDVGTRLIKKLSAAGHSVIHCTPSQAASHTESLQKRVNKANVNQVDIFVSIHFNKADGKAFRTDKPIGTEIFALKHTSMPAILIECCFVDSQADMNLFDAEKMADAIKVGLIGDAQDTSESQPGILKVTQKTILKPSTLQSSDLPPETLIDIDLGEYPVLDFRREERHYWLKWPDKSQGDRDVHFVFDEYAEVKET